MDCRNQDGEQRGLPETDLPQTRGRVKVLVQKPGEDGQLLPVSVAMKGIAWL